MRCKSCGETEHEYNASNCHQCGRSLKTAATGRTINLNARSDDNIVLTRPIDTAPAPGFMLWYALILVLIAIVVIGVLNLFSPKLEQWFGNKPIQTTQQVTLSDPVEIAKRYKTKLDELEKGRKIFGVVEVPDNSCRVAFDGDLDHTIYQGFG